MSRRKSSLDRIARHHGVVDQQAQRDDECGNRDLLQIQAHHAAIPRLMASVMGMDRAIRSAERQSQNPMAETNTTRMIAS